MSYRAIGQTPAKTFHIVNLFDSHSSLHCFRHGKAIRFVEEMQTHAESMAGYLAVTNRLLLDLLGVDDAGDPATAGRYRELHQRTDGRAHLRLTRHHLLWLLDLLAMVDGARGERHSLIDRREFRFFRLSALFAEDLGRIGAGQLRAAFARPGVVRNVFSRGARSSGRLQLTRHDFWLLVVISTNGTLACRGMNLALLQLGIQIINGGRLQPPA